MEQKPTYSWRWAQLAALAMMFDYDELEAAEEKIDSCDVASAEPLAAEPESVAAHGEDEAPASNPASADIPPASVEELQPSPAPAASSEDESQPSGDEAPPPKVHLTEAHPASVELLPPASAPRLANEELAPSACHGATVPQSEPVHLSMAVGKDSSGSLSTSASDPGNTPQSSDEPTSLKTVTKLEHAETPTSTAMASPEAEPAKATEIGKERRVCFGLASWGLWKVFFGAPAEQPN